MIGKRLGVSATAVLVLLSASAGAGVVASDLWSRPDDRGRVHRACRDWLLVPLRGCRLTGTWLREHQLLVGRRAVGRLEDELRGDGHAAEKIVRAIVEYSGQEERR